MQNACGFGGVVVMSVEIIQVRDVPADDVRRLRARASAQGMSLSAYLRGLIRAEVSRPTMGELVARVGAREPVDVPPADIRAAIDRDRRR